MSQFAQGEGLHGSSEDTDDRIETDSASQNGRDAVTGDPITEAPFEPSAIAIATARQCVKGHRMDESHTFCGLCGGGPDTSSDFSASHLRQGEDNPVKKLLKPVPIAVGSLVLVGLLLAVILAATGSNNKTMTVSVADYTGTCSQSVESGASVVVDGNGGNELASGTVDNGTDSTTTGDDGTTIPYCAFTAVLTVPNGQDTYNIIVGITNPVSFSLSDLNNDDWNPTIDVDCPSDLSDC
jgi:hypothetical protein